VISDPSWSFKGPTISSVLILPLASCIAVKCLMVLLYISCYFVFKLLFCPSQHLCCFIQGFLIKDLIIIFFHKVYLFYCKYLCFLVLFLCFLVLFMLLFHQIEFFDIFLFFFGTNFRTTSPILSLNILHISLISAS